MAAKRPSFKSFFARDRLVTRLEGTTLWTVLSKLGHA